ncbi:Protein DegV [Paraconexibacter sp. AEG42_29]|uniref:Protein DegV n=1 Tax=Paraconexibacter sp. AEG42_29 TaxID=2997339 RepID=A0AAU7ATF1_9ACTN
MSPVTLVSDSTHSMPPDVITRAGLEQVSLYVNHGTQTQRESELDLQVFYDRLRTDSKLPTTSQPSIGDFLAVYEPLLQAGQDILSIHISGAISGTVETARQAAEDARGRFPDRRIEVVDSRSVAGGLAMILLAAAAGIDAGEDLDALLVRVGKAVTETRIWFAVDTLEFLRKGGRIGSAAAWVGGALKIKPILTVDGEVVPIERVRTSGRAFQRLVTAMDELVAAGKTAWCIQHIQAPEEAERLAVEGRRVFGREPLLISEIGAVVGTYAGPGLLGVGGLPTELADA